MWTAKLNIPSDSSPLATYIFKRENKEHVKDKSVGYPLGG